MKRVVWSSLIALIILSTGGLGYYFYQRSKLAGTSPLHAIPGNTAFFIQANNGASLIEFIKESKFIPEVNTSSTGTFPAFFHLDSLIRQDEKLSAYWSKQAIYLSAHPTKFQDFDFLLICVLPRGITANHLLDFAKQLGTGQYTTMMREYENVYIHDFKLKDQTHFSFAISQGLLIASKATFLVENAIRQLKTGASIKRSKVFQKTQLAIKEKDEIILYLNTSGLASLLQNYSDQGNSKVPEFLNSFARWSGFNLRTESEGINFTGYLSSNDSLDFIHIFSNQQAIKSKMYSLLPLRTAFFYRCGSSDFSSGLKHLTRNHLYFNLPGEIELNSDQLDMKNKEDTRSALYNWFGNEIGLLITEPVSKNLKNNTYAIIHTRNKANAENLLLNYSRKAGQGRGAEYKKYPLQKLPIGNSFSDYYSKLFEALENPYYTFIDDFVVFANQQSALKSLIDDIEDNRLLIKNPVFEKEFNSGSNSFTDFFLDLQKSSLLLQTGLGRNLPVQFNEQMIQPEIISFRIYRDENQYAIKGHVSRGKAQTASILLNWAAQLDTISSAGPYILQGENNNFNIAIQDDALQLYFFDEAGNLLWKKSLEEKILGTIYGVDFFKNNTRQLLFNTASRLYLLDFSGSDAGRFPIRLPAPTTQACLYHQTESQAEGRIITACTNGNLYAYEINGKPVTNWQPDRNYPDINRKVEVLKYYKDLYYTVSTPSGIFVITEQGKYKLELAKQMDEWLGIVPADSGRIYKLVGRDSTSLQLYTANGNKQPLNNAPFTNAEVHIAGDFYKSEGWMASKSINTGIEIRNLQSGNSCQINITNSGTGRFYSASGIQSGSLIAYQPEQSEKTYLLFPDCRSVKGSPVKGKGPFTIFNHPVDNKLLIAIGSSDGEILLYSSE